MSETAPRWITCRHGPAPGGADDYDVLETDAPFSESLIWRYQRGYFARVGRGAWREDVVPSHLTTHPWLARAYARVVHRFAGRSPLVLEVGAGSGELGFQFLKAWTERHGDSSLQYVMSDAEPAIVDEWKRDPYLRRHVTSGLLEFARFDATAAGDIELAVSGRRLGPRIARPLIVIANYVFDNLPEDAFVVASGALRERRVTTCRRRDATDELAELELYFAPHDQRRRYEPDVEASLARYREQIGDGAFTWPIGAVRACRRLIEMADGGILFLVADKGFRRPPRGAPLPQLQVHGSLSSAVDFGALDTFFGSAGASIVHLAEAGPSLALVSYAVGLAHGDAESVALTLRDELEHNHPLDRLTLQRRLGEAHDQLATAEIFALVRLSGGDVRLFERIAPTLIARAGSLDAVERRELLRLVKWMYGHYFPAGLAADLSFTCGQLLLELGEHAPAARLFGQSLALHGDNRNTHLNLALCYQGLGDLAPARAHVAHVLARHGEDGDALALRAQLDR